jgi:hypothetical protein
MLFRTWLLRSNSDDRHLYARIAASGFHFGFCRCLRSGSNVWISTGCMALRRGGDDLGAGCRAALVNPHYETPRPCRIDHKIPIMELTRPEHGEYSGECRLSSPRARGGWHSRRLRSYRSRPSARLRSGASIAARPPSARCRSGARRRTAARRRRRRSYCG